MARRRTIEVLTSGVLFVVAAFVAGFVFAVFTDSWVLAVVAGLVVAAAVEWVYAAVVWRPGRRRSRGGPEGGLLRRGRCGPPCLATRSQRRVIGPPCGHRACNATASLKDLQRARNAIAAFGLFSETELPLLRASLKRGILKALPLCV